MTPSISLLNPHALRYHQLAGHHISSFNPHKMCSTPTAPHESRVAPLRLSACARDVLLEDVSRGAATFFRRRLRRVAMARELAREAAERRLAARREVEGWREVSWSEAIRSFWLGRAACLSWPSELVKFKSRFQPEILAPQRMIARGKRPRSPSSAPKRGRPKRRRKTGLAETETQTEVGESVDTPAGATMIIDARNLVFGQWLGETPLAAEELHLSPTLKSYCSELLRSVAGCDESTSSETKREERSRSGGDEGSTLSSIPIVPVKRILRGGMLTVLCGLPLQISQDLHLRDKRAILRAKPDLMPALASPDRTFSLLEKDHPSISLPCQHSWTSRLVALTRQADTPSRSTQSHNLLKSKYQCKLGVKDLSCNPTPA